MKEGGESDSNNDSNPSFSTIGFLSTNLNDESQIRDDLTLIDNVGIRSFLRHAGFAPSVHSLQSTSHHSASRRRELLLLRRFPETPRFRGNGVRIDRSLLDPPQTRTRISPFPRFLTPRRSLKSSRRSPNPAFPQLIGRNAWRI